MIEKNEEGGDLDGRKKAKGSLCGSFGIFVAKLKYYLQQGLVRNHFPTAPLLYSLGVTS